MGLDGILMAFDPGNGDGPREFPYGIHNFVDDVLFWTESLVRKGDGFIQGVVYPINDALVVEVMNYRMLSGKVKHDRGVMVPAQSC
jgi:hypothetical protein